MMNMPKVLGRMTSVVAARTTSRRRASGKTAPPPFGDFPGQPACASAKRRRQFSTMMTAPSTMSPKSSAPKLMRLPLMRASTMPVIVSSIDSGMTSVVTSAARRLPSSANSTAMTRRAPSNKFVRTVAMVLSTSVVRS
jgi:hypothetical protein